MPSLKDLKNRIASVKSTRKITSAMKMVAASKLRRAQEQAMAARPYAERMERMLGSLAASLKGEGDAPKLMSGTGADHVHLLIVITSDRGLCGAFNGSIVREARKQILALKNAGKQVKVLCVGRKGAQLLRRDFASHIIGSTEDVGRKKLSYADAEKIAQQVLTLFDESQFDVAKVIYNKFKSAISQIVTTQQLVPFAVPETAENADSVKAAYEFEPDEATILTELLPRNLGVQLYRALLESLASEHGARMTAMDNATRNSGDMINKLTLVYNRTRQAYITKEMIEIVSGAEAV